MVARGCLFIFILGSYFSSSSKNEKPAYLFVILSNDGKIQKASDGTYQLLLDHREVEKVLAFTDFHESTEEKNIQC